MDRVWDAIFAKGVRYHVIDIDAEVVNTCRAGLKARGQNPDAAQQAANTALPLPDSAMDFVFSSHCLEHSPNLAATFSEIKRVLRPDGKIFFSVPFGFDNSDEHLLFLGVEEWLRVCEAAGLFIKGWTVGRTYADAWDLSVLADAREGFDAATITRLDRDYRKAGRMLLAHDDASIVYSDSLDRPPFSITRSFCVERAADYLLFLRHSWSGIIRVTDAEGQKRDFDLFDRADHIGSSDVCGMTAPLQVEVIGKNRSAYDNQAVVFGILV